METNRPLIKAIVFDLDGTLLDTEPLSTKAINQAIQKRDATKLVDAKLKSRIIGLRDHDWATLIIAELGLQQSITVDELVKEWTQNMADLLSNVEACPGAYSLTQRFEELKMPTAIATSSVQQQVNLKQRKHAALFNRFSAIITGDNEEVKHGKPAPDIFLAAARKLAIDPQYCLAFEDSPLGVLAAKAAGMHVVAIPDATVDVSRFQKADVIVSSLERVDINAWEFNGA